MKPIGIISDRLLSGSWASLYYTKYMHVENVPIYDNIRLLYDIKNDIHRVLSTTTVTTGI